MTECVLVTGSGGLIGSEAVRYFCARDAQVVGIDNDMRKYFFGEKASTQWNAEQLQQQYRNYTHVAADIRDQERMESLFQSHRFSAIIHTAAQPSHDWAAKEPLTDFTINALGTHILLEMTRRHCPDAVFIFTSTNKVYGDRPNNLPLVERELRWEIAPDHPYQDGIDESMSIDQCLHSVFGASKVAADVLVQEYGNYFGLKTGVFRGGCLTGPAHSGAQLHGFLSYLIQCIATESPYTVFGYKGKQVRDNIHASDVMSAFAAFIEQPRAGEVYNIGGTRESNTSMLEAIADIEALLGKKARITIDPTARIGDHIWYVSSMRKFKSHYPHWKHRYTGRAILEEMVHSISR